MRTLQVCVSERQTEMMFHYAELIFDSCMSVAWTKPTSVCENQSGDSLEPVPLSSYCLFLSLN